MTTQLITGRALTVLLTLQNPSVPAVTVAATGTYSVTATLGACASTSAGIVDVVVNAIPDTPVIGSNSPVCSGGTINLTSNVTGTSFAWTVPGGYTSGSQNPSIINATVADSGIYTLIESANGCSSAPDSILVVVYAVPPAPLAGANTPVCVGGTLSLTATYIAGASYAWTATNGFTSSDQDPVITGVTLADAGTYTVSDTVNGCISSSAQVIVTVVAAPVASFTSNAPQCVGSPVSFDNTGSTGGGYTFLWNFGPNATPDTSSDENPTGIVFSTGGSQTVTLSIGNGVCTITDTQTITITSLPQAYFVNNGPACFPPGQIVFTDSSSGAIATWFWNFGPGATPSTSTAQGPDTVVYSTPGVKTITLTVTSGSCSSTTTETADVGTIGADFTSSVPKTGITAVWANRLIFMK